MIVYITVNKTIQLEKGSKRLYTNIYLNSIYIAIFCSFQIKNNQLQLFIYIIMFEIGKKNHKQYTEKQKNTQNYLSVLYESHLVLVDSLILQVFRL
ncbi:unnamed protein product [Paramecium primaurelia]|uniref:Transmembrane protein n=1 Tax=Paramecium primaurelia TaxID=5886 RepID=A0A8S1LSJ4_PARPR|nr:unnamed protein product [Paramecium primaurelia]